MRTFGFQWHLTHRCNRRCTHCYQGEYSCREDPERLKSVADAVLSALPDRSVSINLTGGEPLLLPWLPDLIDHMRGYANLEEVNVITNGTLAPEGLLSRLAQSPVVHTIKVSLESADPAINDAIRGEGHLGLLADNLAVLMQTRPVVAMTTLSRLNLPSLASTLTWAQARGLAGVIVERFVPLGQSLGRSQEVLGPGGWRQALCTLTSHAGLEVDDEDLLPYRAFWLSFDRDGSMELQGALCNLGDESMALMPDGTVYPCRRLPLPQGRVLEHPFPDILRSLARYDVQRIRGTLRGEVCGRCTIEGCAGCRAMALALHGDPLGDDPVCGRRG